MAEAAKGVGRPKVGGTFELLDHEGRAFTDQDMKGGFSLVSFCCLPSSREIENYTWLADGQNQSLTPPF